MMFQKGYSLRQIPILLTVGLAACVTVGTNLQIERRFQTERFSRENLEYTMEVEETSNGGICWSRKITLRGKNRSNTDPNHISHVEATDRNCDDSFEQFRFRYSRDAGVDRNILTDDLLNIYYSLK